MSVNTKINNTKINTTKINNTKINTKPNDKKKNDEPDNYYLFKLVKCINILYVGVLYSIIGGGMALGINYIYPERTEEICKEMNIFRLGLETTIMSSTLFLMVYFTRTLVKKIGSPLHNVAGFDFYRLKELTGGVVLSLALILYSPKLVQMARTFSERVTNHFLDKDDNSIENDPSSKNKLKNAELAAS